MGDNGFWNDENGYEGMKALRNGMSAELAVIKE